MIWSTSSSSPSSVTTSQLMLIGTAAFCISFGVIYTLIYCYKSRRKHLSDENERLRDELLRQKFLARRRSTSLSSPPQQSHSVINPNYNGSPFKVPQRHLRSTSASYSPTHYLSPHHRRSSTPTRPWQGDCTTSSTCSGNKSASNVTQMSSSNALGSPRNCVNHCHHNHPHHHRLLHGSYNITPTNCNNSGKKTCGNINILINNAPTGTTSKVYPQGQKLSRALPSKPASLPIPSKICNNSWDNHQNNSNDLKTNQKFFSFGPIPPARKSLNVSNAFASATTTRDEHERNSNGNFDKEDEKQPLLVRSTKSNFIESKTKLEKFALDDAICEEEEESDSRKDNYLKRKNYTPDLFNKEHVLNEEIPYYTEQMSCN